MPLEQYDGIACMIHAMLAKGLYTDPDKSVLIRASIKLDYSDTYGGGSDLEFLKVFIACLLRWLKMNCLLGETSRLAGQIPRQLPYRQGATMVLQECRMIPPSGPQVDLGNSSTCKGCRRDSCIP